MTVGSAREPSSVASWHGLLDCDALASADRTASQDDLFGRLLAALVAPPAGEPPGVLVGYQPPLAVVELPLSGAGVLALDVAGAAPDEVGRRLRHVLEGYQGGVIFLVVVGGGDELKATLLAADREAPDPAKLSLYHLAQDGHLRRLGGRRSGVVERAVRLLPTLRPVALAEVPELIERGRREREEAARFASELRGRFAWVTALLLGVCVVLYGLGALWSQRPLTDALRAGADPDVLLRMGANAAALVRQGEVWRLLASAFLHAGVMHLLFNMVALQSFGGFLEAVLGWRRYLVVFGASALGGSLASALISRASFSVGASGAMWGLMLAGFALSRARENVLPARIARQLRQRLVMVLVINVLFSFLPGIDLYAHFGGGAIGFALVAGGILVPRSGGAPGASSRPLRALALVTAVALAASIVLALFTGRPWT
jgi:rhomboid protease GluP